MPSRPTILALLAATLLPGCVFADIEKELASANTKMENANDRLDQIETSLEEIKRTNELLDDVEPQLEGLTKLDHLEKLETLQSIDASLKRLDEHLASLRETIHNIDSTIPFLTISADDDEAVEEAQAEAGTGDEPPKE
ncbi:MAG: hypothetical protein ACYTGP_05740 [Planctomycetota bacterium]|jgi:chromosome segregation ATPase